MLHKSYLNFRKIWWVICSQPSPHNKVAPLHTLKCLGANKCDLFIPLQWSGVHVFIVTPKPGCAWTRRGCDGRSLHKTMKGETALYRDSNFIHTCNQFNLKVGKRLCITPFSCVSNLNSGDAFFATIYSKPSISFILYCRFTKYRLLEYPDY